MSAILEVEGVSVELSKNKIIDNVSFSVNKGEVVGFLGPNGAGKSTLMNAIVGSFGKISGKILLNGKYKVSGNELRRHVAIIPQEDIFYFDLTLEENLEYFASKVGAPKVLVSQLIDDFNLNKYRHFVARNLSGGYRKQLNILIGLIQRPEIVFLDEPSVGLDPVLRRNLWERIFKIKKSGVSVCISTHYMDEAQVLCDKVYLINAGKIIAAGSPDELVEKYAKDSIVVFTILQAISQEENDKLALLVPRMDFSVIGASVLVRMPIIDSEKIQKMKDALQKLGKQIIKIRQKEPDLEQVFINLTGNELKGN